MGMLMAARHERHKQEKQGTGNEQYIGRAVD